MKIALVVGVVFAILPLVTAWPAGAVDALVVTRTIVWKDAKAYEVGTPILRKATEQTSQVVVREIVPYIACLVPKGTGIQVSRVENSWLWAAVVTTGADTGCSGVIGPRDFQTPGEITGAELRERAAKEEASAPPRPEPKKSLEDVQREICRLHYSPIAERRRRDSGESWVDAQDRIACEELYREDAKFMRDLRRKHP